MRYSLTALRAFEAAGRRLNLTKAAAELVVTRPAISKQIRLLENDLGVQLLQRTPGGVSLTGDGQSLFHAVSRSFSQIIDAADRIRDKQDRSGKLRILVEYDFAAAWLAKNIGHFLIEHSGHAVDLQTEKQGALRFQDRFDLRIFYTDTSIPALEKERFDIVELCSWGNLPLCAPDYLTVNAIGQASSLSEVTLLHDRDRRLWTEWLSSAGMDTSIAESGGTVFDSTSGCLSAAVAGAGVAIGDTLTALDLLNSGQLVAPLEHVQPSKEKYLLIIDKSTAIGSESEQFKEWLLEGMKGLKANQTELLYQLQNEFQVRAQSGI